MNKSFEKMVLLPEKSIKNQSEYFDQQQIQAPGWLKVSSQLDKSIIKILNSEYDDYTKARLYTDVLEKFLIISNQNVKKFSTPEILFPDIPPPENEKDKFPIESLNEFQSEISGSSKIKPKKKLIKKTYQKRSPAIKIARKAKSKAEKKLQQTAIESENEVFTSALESQLQPKDVSLSESSKFDTTEIENPFARKPKLRRSTDINPKVTWDNLK